MERPLKIARFGGILQIGVWSLCAEIGDGSACSASCLRGAIFGVSFYGAFCRSLDAPPGGPRALSDRPDLAHIAKMTQPQATLLAAGILALALLVLFRWEMGSTTAAGLVFKLHRWTGAVYSCQISGPGPLKCD
jgi:hypothetical protein